MRHPWSEQNFGRGTNQQLLMEYWVGKPGGKCLLGSWDLADVNQGPVEVVAPVSCEMKLPCGCETLCGQHVGKARHQNMGVDEMPGEKKDINWAGSGGL